jgi:xylulokinase
LKENFLFFLVYFTDILFDRLRYKTDLSRIQAIGGSALHAPIFFSSTVEELFPTLDPSQSLLQQLPAHLTLQYTPMPTDTTSHAHAMALESALGGPDKMAYRVGVTGHAFLLAAQLIKLHEHNDDAWRRTKRIGTLNTLLEAIFQGRWNISAEDAWLSGMWNVGSSKSSGSGSGSGSGSSSGSGTVNGQSTPPISTQNWDKTVCDYIAGGSIEGQQLREILGDVELNPRTRSRPITRYWTDRYGFNPGE